MPRPSRVLLLSVLGGPLILLALFHLGLISLSSPEAWSFGQPERESTPESTSLIRHTRPSNQGVSPPAGSTSGHDGERGTAHGERGTAPGVRGTAHGERGTAPGVRGAAPGESTTLDQCRATYPLLFSVLDKELEEWRTRLPRGEVSEVLARPFCTSQCLGIEILGNNTAVVLVDRGSWQTRHANTLAMVRETLRRFPGLIPPQKIIISTGDSAPSLGDFPLLAYTKRPGETPLLIPDFTFWARREALLDGWDVVSRRIRAEAAQIPFADREDRVFWRGATANNRPGRSRLLALARNNPQDFDVREVVFPLTKANALNQPPSFNQPPCSKAKLCAPPSYSTPENHCHYRYLVHTPGVTYSSRLKYLLACGSVVFVPDSPWREYWQHLLAPGVTHLPIKEDYHDLGAALKYARGLGAAATTGSNAAEVIGSKAQALVAEYLSPDAVYCYMGAVLSGLAHLGRTKNMSQ
jgi:hypothetical protein